MNYAILGPDYPCKKIIIKFKDRINLLEFNQKVDLEAR